MNRPSTSRTAPRLTPRLVVARYADLFRETRGWLVLVAIIFVASIVAGVIGATVNPAWHTEQIRQASQRLGPALQALRSGDNARAIATIFWNNLSIALLIVGTGALVFPVALGAPVISIGGNGYLLGAIATLSNQGLDRLLISILPHGIIELPALIIAGAWSLKMGINWLLPSAAGRRGDVWRATVFEGLWIVPLIAVMLAVAAVVEVLITAAIVRSLGGG